MKESDYMTFRMQHCSECKRANDNEGADYICHGTNDEIDECIDATTPMEDPYQYGA